jgi:hypothetical protein
MDHVHEVEMQGNTFNVWLEPGSSFDEVVVQWRDKNGEWHH